MSTDFSFTKHATAGVSKLLATSGGAHIYNVTLTTAADNGNIIGRGAMVSLDNYAEATPTSFSGKVVWQAANGNWYVEVISASNALLVYNPPVTEDVRAKEDNFYLAAGEVARAHELMPGDIFEVSALAFSGTPAKNAAISSISSKKMVIGS